MNQIDCLLVFPPQSTVVSPYLGIARLASFLSKRGVSVSCIDANLMCNESLLSKEYLECCIDRLSKKESILLRRPAQEGRTSGNYLEVVEGLLRGDDIPRKVEHAKGMIRRERGFRDLNRFYNNWRVLDDAMFTISQANSPLHLDFGIFEPRMSCTGIEGIVRGSTDIAQNVFIPPLKKSVVPIVSKSSAPLICISIVSKNQVIPGITLAKLAKESLESTHIIVIGPYFSMMESKLKEILMKIPFLDGIVVRDSEMSLLALTNRLSGYHRTADMSRIPNLIYRMSNGRTGTTNTTWSADLSTIPRPRFDLMPLQDYLSPHPILPFEMSPNLRRRESTVRNTTYLNACGRKQRDYYELVVRSLIDLSDEFKTPYFKLVYPQAASWALDGLSRSLIKNEVSITWSCETTPSVIRTKRTISHMHEAGCRHISFKLNSRCMSESSSMPTLECSFEVFSKTIQHAASEGILITVTLELPTEPESNDFRTLEFLRDNSEFIDTVNLNVSNPSEVASIGKEVSIQHPAKGDKPSCGDRSPDEKIVKNPSDLLCSHSEYCIDVPQEGPSSMICRAVDFDAFGSGLTSAHGRKRIRMSLRPSDNPVQIDSSSVISLAHGSKMRMLYFSPDDLRQTESKISNERERAHGLLAYKRESGRCIAVDARGAEILGLLEQGMTIKTLENVLSARWSIPVDEVLEGITKFLIDFAQYGIVEVG